MVMNKKALSEIIGYVLLISITLALSISVYSWLKFYVAEEEVDACSDNVNIIIRDYECKVPIIGEFPGSLNITIKNKGLFSIDGYILRVHDRVDAEFGLYLFNNTGAPLKPGEEVNEEYTFNEIINNDGKLTGQKITKVTLVEIQPFIQDENGKINCKSSTSQKVICK